MKLKTSVFKPSLVVNSAQGQGHRVLTGSSGGPGQPYSFINQNDIIFIVNGLQPSFWPGQPAGSSGFLNTLIFSQTRLGSSPRSTAGPGFKTMLKTTKTFYKRAKKKN